METKTDKLIFASAIIMGLLCLIILINDHEDIQKKEIIKVEQEIEPSEKLNYSGKNLTYSYYNYTTKKVTYNVTDIPIYNKLND